MRVLVTGGAGFIGSAVCHALLARGACVINVDKLTYAANPRSLDAIAHDPRYAFERHDICDRAAMDAVLAKHQPTAMLHLAAESHVDRSITGAAAFIDTNIAGTYHLLEAARHYCAGLAPNERTAFRFGWKPRRHFEAGLEQTVQWYLANRAWWEPLQTRVYGGERLGLLEPAH
jgi:dTDP-glucose 4,6-dehydratase